MVLILSVLDNQGGEPGVFFIVCWTWLAGLRARGEGGGGQMHNIWILGRGGWQSLCESCVSQPKWHILDDQKDAINIKIKSHLLANIMVL